MKIKNFLQQQRIFSILFVLLLHFSCDKKQSEIELLNKENPYGSYGQELTLNDKKTIKEILENPNEFLGNEVLVSGKVLEVCPMRGCWIDIVDLYSDYNLRVKVIDGEIVFPLSAKGKIVDVQGFFNKLEFTSEQAINWKIHLAKEKGLILKADEVVINKDDLYEFRINASGSRIYSSKLK